MLIADVVNYFPEFEVVIQNISKQSLDSQSKTFVHESSAYDLIHRAP